MVSGIRDVTIVTSPFKATTVGHAAGTLGKGSSIAPGCFADPVHLTTNSCTPSHANRIATMPPPAPFQVQTNAMITYAMTDDEAARDARQDLCALVNKVTGIAKRQEHQHRKQRDRHSLIETLIPWRSPRGNNWLIVLRTNKKETTVSTMAWYRGRDQRIRGVWLNMANTDAYYLSAHFLERYMERFAPTRDPIKRLQDFFFANHSFAVHATKDLGSGRHEVMIGMVHGLAMGIGDINTKVVTITTFLDHGKLGNGQWELAEYLDLKRELATYPKGFRTHVERLIEAERKKAA
jgi:hypothetical protein